MIRTASALVCLKMKNKSYVVFPGIPLLRLLKERGSVFRISKEGNARVKNALEVLLGQS